MDACEGTCKRGDLCLGEVKRVHVFGGEGSPCGYDWGYWNYCDYAINLDKGEGFRVIEESELDEN